jgi:hypothetical protein
MGRVSSTTRNIVKGRPELLKTVIALALALPVCISAEEIIRKFEIRRSDGRGPGKLVAYVGSRELNLSTTAVKAWEGWHPGIILFSEVLPAGREELRMFNAITGSRLGITVETGVIEDVSVARLSNGENRLVLFLRDNSGRIPSLALADPARGVYRRIPSATAGAIINDQVVVRYFRRSDVHAKEQDLQKRQPLRMAVISLATGRPVPAR